MIDLNVAAQRRLFEDLLAQGRLIYVHTSVRYSFNGTDNEIEGPPRPETFEEHAVPHGLADLVVCRQGAGAQGEQLVRLDLPLYPVTG